MPAGLMPYLEQTLLWLFLFNVFVVGVILYLRQSARAIQDWPSVPGSITNSKVAHDRSHSASGATPYVRYQYEVQGKLYKDGNVFPGIMMVAGQAQAEKVVARYPAGASVTVYYNPKNPAQAVLEKDSNAQTGRLWGALIFGNLLIPIAVLIARFVLKVG